MSSLGRIKSITRRVTHSNGRTQHVEGRFLRYAKNHEGYCFVHLQRSPKSSVLFVHRIVADAFLGPKPDGMVTDHIDRDRTNNVVSNLRYCTHRESCRNRGVSIAARAKRKARK